MKTDFATITMSPAIDTTLEIEAFPYDNAVIKAGKEVYSVGGKGLNSAHWLSVRGASVLVTGLLGKENAAEFERFMRENKLVDEFIRVPLYSRINVMFVSPYGMFKVNRSGFPDLRSEDYDIKTIIESCQKAHTCIMAGSIPKAMPDDVYAQVIDAMHSVGSAAVLDASGKPFALGLEAHPDVIKPNRQECSEYLGKTISTKHDIYAALEALGKKAKLVILSDGASGSWFFDAEGSGEIKFMAAPEVEVVDTTGAGDALLAEFSYRYFGLASDERKLTEELMSHAVAAGSATCTLPGARAPSAAFVDNLAKNLMLKKEQ
ncbi:MAG: hypothetical protein J6V41_06535 [Kiritimatiellae bacterium]|nr:hypothetical protein [Kiritimatiellia bacterium]